MIHTQVNHHCGLPSEVTGGLCASHYLVSNLSTDAAVYFVDDSAAPSDVLLLLPRGYSSAERRRRAAPAARCAWRRRKL